MRFAMSLALSLRSLIVSALPLIVFACNSVPPNPGATAKTCDPNSCDPGLECIDNGTNVYCRKACTTNGDCADREVCFAQAKASMQSYCVFPGATDGGIVTVKDAKTDSPTVVTTCPATKNASLGSSACTSCMATSCCSQITSCFTSSSSDCAYFASCIRECGNDSSCQSSCYETVTSATYSLWSSLNSCQSSHCYDVCQNLE